MATIGAGAIGSGVGSLIGTLPATIDKLTEAVNKMNQVAHKTATSALAPLTAGMNLFAAATSGTINQIERFVEKANPAAAFRFNRALDDLAATMGQILTPVLDGITHYIRAFADSLQGLRPAYEKFMEGVKQIIDALIPLTQAIMELFGPALQAMGYLIQNIVVPAVRMLSDVLIGFVEVAKGIIEVLSAGMIEFDDYKSKSSVGAAVRPAAYGKIEDIGKRTTLAALNQGNIDPNKETARNTARTNTLLEKLIDKLPGGKEARGFVGEKIDWVKRQARSAKKWAQRQLEDLF